MQRKHLLENWRQEGLEKDMVERYKLPDDFFERAGDAEEDTLDYGDLDDQRGAQATELPVAGGCDLDDRCTASI